MDPDAIPLIALMRYNMRQGRRTPESKGERGFDQGQEVSSATALAVDNSCTNNMKGGEGG
jgi:hypothetical protein